MSAPGERVKLKVWRDRAERTIEAKLGGAEKRRQAGRRRERAPASAARSA